MKMKTIYKFVDSKAETLKLYDNQLLKLGCTYKDIFIMTSFGKTHLIETGDITKPPLLVFHGGNSTTAYNLLMCRFLLDNFHIYAVDIVGHPGKSAEVCLPHHGYSYGVWASEVIDGLGFNNIRCLGCSFGGGILAKLMCVTPEKVIKSVLLVPSGINNAFPINSAKMMIPLMKYVRTKDDKYIIETALFMAITENALDSNAFDTIKNSFDHVKTKVGMPSNVSKKLMRNCNAPTLVIAGEMDCLFPSKKVLKRAKKIITNCTTYELKGKGHMFCLDDKEKNIIIDFLK